ncbi:MAG TPA: hypothetical protein VL201_02365 [Patescibacteria group bacterium]|nr:hypothetical protein [Patescibacteria group bacterium]
MSASITTIKPSHNIDKANLTLKYNYFFEGLTSSEKKILTKKIGFNSQLMQQNNKLQNSLDALKQELDTSINRKYRDLTIMVGEGITIALLLYIVYELFHRNKLYQEAEETLPEAQKTVSLKKNEQLAPKNAILRHNYNTLAKYTDKLNTIQQKLEECNRSLHDNDSIESCLKEIASISKAPI